MLSRCREGVCDTPLHLFGHFMDIMMVVGYATSPTSGRMPLRPYTCSVISWVTWWLSNMLPRRHEGRMRYAPTLVRSYHGYNDGCWTCYFAAVRAYAIRPYTFAPRVRLCYDHTSLTLHWSEVSVISHERTLHWSKASVKSHKSYSSLEWS